MLFLVSCNDDDNGVPNSVDETRGWIQFPTTNPDVILIQTPNIYDLGVSVQVPITDSDLEISYRMVQVSGPDPNTVFSNTGKFTVPAGVTSWAGPLEDNNTNNAQILPPIKFNIAEAPENTPMTFDVILTATNSSKISVGLGSDFPITQRLSIPCFNPDVIPSDYFTGDYALADVTATIGPGNGTENFATGNTSLTVDPTNPNIRVFRAPIVPAFNPEIETISIEFVPGDNIVRLLDVDPNLSCDGATLYIYVAESVANSSPWDVCNDEAITITYVEDSLGSCGGPFTSSFSLTKI